MLWWFTALMVVLSVAPSQAQVARCTISANVDRAGKVEAVSVEGRGMNEAIGKFHDRVGGSFVPEGSKPADWHLPQIFEFKVSCRRSGRR